MKIDNTQKHFEKTTLAKNYIFLTHKRDRNTDNDLINSFQELREVEYSNLLQEKEIKTFPESKGLFETVTKCNCKNSQCLKLYCECFSNNKICDPRICSCLGCFNNTDNKVNIIIIFLKIIFNYFLKI
jgi:hypothetical protein